MRVQELVRHLEDDGWLEMRRLADARLLSHALRPGIITIVGDDRAELPAGTLRSVFTPASRAVTVKDGTT